MWRETSLEGAFRRQAEDAYACVFCVAYFTMPSTARIYIVGLQINHELQGIWMTTVT
jgi:hypothetical protein